MRQQGARLAPAHCVTPDRLPDRLLARLAANEDVLIDTCSRLASRVCWANPSRCLQAARSIRTTVPTLVNPANHATSPEAIETCKVDPYVMVAEVYAVAPHIGRGGSACYTDTPGSMYRLIVESLLGLRLQVGRLHVAPCLPAHWDGLKIRRVYPETVYHIYITQTHP